MKHKLGEIKVVDNMTIKGRDKEIKIEGDEGLYTVYSIREMDGRLARIVIERHKFV